MATAVVSLAFAWVAGLAGLALYLCVAAGVHFGVQAITYLQHWGLGVDSVEGAAHVAYFRRRRRKHFAVDGFHPNSASYKYGYTTARKMLGLQSQPA